MQQICSRAAYSISSRSSSSHLPLGQVEGVLKGASRKGALQVFGEGLLLSGEAPVAEPAACSPASTGRAPGLAATHSSQSEIDIIGGAAHQRGALGDIEDTLVDRRNLVAARRTHKVRSGHRLEPHSAPGRRW